jgi:RNA polymerase sigma-70 factor (ECF subfamily)
MDAQRRVALELLFGEHAPAVAAYARRRTDVASADDVVATVFTIAWRRLDELPADALPWLLACARRVLANQRRAERRRAALTERVGRHSPTAVPPLSELHDGGDGALLHALDQLPERDREALLLVAWEGLDHARAAAALGCSRGALTVRIHRARRRLAAALDRAADSPIDLQKPLEATP